MNKITIGLLSGLVGFIAGSLTTYICLNKKCETDYYVKLRTAIDEECERLREWHKNLIQKDLIIRSEEAKNDIEDPPYSDIETEKDEYHKRLRELGDILVEDVQDEMNTEGPKLIDEDEYRFLPEGRYETRELQFLRGDGTVLDENDEIVTDPGIYISGLEEYLKKLPNMQCVYILVESIGVAVELVVLDDLYQNLFGEE